MTAQCKRLKARGIMVDVAYELHRYIEWRAGREGVGYKLSPEFFRAAIDAGTVSFFGVEIDDEHEDAVQPVLHIASPQGGDRPGQGHSQQLAFQLCDTHTIRS